MNILVKIRGSFGLNLVQILSVVVINLVLVKRFGLKNMDLYYYFQTIFQLLFFFTASVLFNSLLIFKRDLKKELTFLTVLYLILGPFLLLFNYTDVISNFRSFDISLINSIFFLWIIRGYLVYVLNILKLNDINRYTNFEIIELAVISLLILIVAFEKIESYIYLMIFSKSLLLLILFFNLNIQSIKEQYSFKLYFKKFSVLYVSNLTGYIYSFSEKTFLLSLDPGILSVFTLAQKFVNPISSVISGSNNLIIIFKTQLMEKIIFLKSILSFNINISIAISLISFIALDFMPQLMFDFISVNPVDKNIFIVISKLLIIAVPFSSAVVIFKKKLLANGEIKIIMIINVIGSVLQLLLLFFLPIAGINKVIYLLLITSILICFTYHFLIFRLSYFKINLFLWVLFIIVTFLLDQLWVTMLSALVILFFNITEIFIQRKKLSQIE